jgi:Ser/Thr protein kinase RdoA (MazF antagonist)
VFVDGHRVWLLDFDDCQVAWPVQDIGVTFFEIGEDEERLPVRRRAFRRGYERVAPWPERHPGEIDVFAASRGLLRINYLVQLPDPDERAGLEGVLEYARVIDAFLDGRYAGD